MRVHYNAIEGYPIFILLLLFGALYNPLIAAGAGVVYIIGRFIYAIGYWQAVEKRGPGAGIFHIAELVLLGCTIMFALQVLRS
jgi:glutathione S-transferase